MQSHHDVWLRELSAIRQESMKVLTDTIGAPGTPVALLDVPRHRNLGDTLIWQGTLTYLTKLGYKLVYQSDHSQYSQDIVDKLPTNTVILLQGGGNLGDLYPMHNNFRHNVVAANHSRKIVLLPQSIFFSNDEELRKTANVFASHPNMVLLAREVPSLTTMKSRFIGNKVSFCHDMAFGLEVTRSANRSREVIYVVRDDKESIRGESDPSGPDWSNGGLLNNTMWHAARYASGFFLRVCGKSSNVSQFIFRSTNDVIRGLNMRAATRSFEKADVVVTDRLHAHVLASLYDTQNFFSDNSYGKIRAVYDATSHRLSCGTPSQSLRDASEKAKHYDK